MFNVEKQIHAYDGEVNRQGVASTDRLELQILNIKLSMEIT